MTRDDIRGRTAPAWLATTIAARFGRTAFGEPRYRLVWAPARFERSGGVWTDWDPRVAATARERGARSPLRRVVEMRWVRKYPGEECWLIERWQPASSYGTPERWYAPTWDGGTVLHTESGAIATLGDYPALGDYEDIGARIVLQPMSGEQVHGREIAGGEPAFQNPMPPEPGGIAAHELLKSPAPDAVPTTATEAKGDLSRGMNSRATSVVSPRITPKPFSPFIFGGKKAIDGRGRAIAGENASPTNLENGRKLAG